VQKTFPQMMWAHAKQRPDAPALREKSFGIWQTTTWSQLGALVRHLACGLAEAGLKRGEHLVVIGENRPRLYAAMLAAQSLGAVPVPLYQDAVAADEKLVQQNQRRLELGFMSPIDVQQARAQVSLDQEQLILSKNLFMERQFLLRRFITSEGLYWAQLSAAALLASLPVMIVGWIAQNHLVRGLSMGAVK